MNFINPIIDVGKVKANTTLQVIFHLLPDSPGITRVVPGCKQCTSYKLLSNNLHVEIELKGIPKHLDHLEFQTFKKIVTVQYSNGTLDVLEIHGKKIRK